MDTDYINRPVRCDSRDLVRIGARGCACGVSESIQICAADPRVHGAITRVRYGLIAVDSRPGAVELRQYIKTALGLLDLLAAVGNAFADLRAEVLFCSATQDVPFHWIANGWE